MARLVLDNAAQIVTAAHAPPLKGDRLGQLTVHENASIAFDAGRVAAVGAADELDGERRVDCTGRTVVPGFVDAHAHPVWAGDRVDELLLKLEGASYAEILATGGGIHHTVELTRAATSDELMEATRARLDAVLAQGTTTLEAKSGYALDVDGELRLLEVLSALDDHPVELVRTLMGAHAVPPGADRTSFIDAVCDELTPEVAKRGLARFCDAFVDQGALSLDEGRQVLEAGRERGLAARIHADELACTRAARLGLELEATSIDHLNRVHDDDARALAADDHAIATLCPVTPFTSDLPYAPARSLVDLGAAIALGSDLNPNAWSVGMPFAIALAVHGMRLTPAEALNAATANSAASLALGDRGRLKVGLVGDAVVLDAPRFEYLAYRLGGAPVVAVVRAGEIVVGDAASV